MAKITLNEDIFFDVPEVEYQLDTNIELEGPKPGEDVGVSGLLLDLIGKVASDINELNQLQSNLENYPEISELIKDFADDENEKLGKIQSALKTISPNAELIMNGAVEAEQEMDPGSPLDEAFADVYMDGHRDHLKIDDIVLHKAPGYGYPITLCKIISDYDAPQEYRLAPYNKKTGNFDENSWFGAPRGEIRLASQDDIYMHESLKEDFWNPSREFEDFTDYLHSKVNYDGWNSLSEKERIDLVTPAIKDYVRKNGHNVVWQILLSDLVDNNYHTEHKVLLRVLQEINESLKEDADYDEIKRLKYELADIVLAIYKGEDPERSAYRKNQIMDRLIKLGVDDNWFEYANIKESLEEDELDRVTQARFDLFHRGNYSLDQLRNDLESLLQDGLDPIEFLGIDAEALDPEIAYSYSVIGEVDPDNVSSISFDFGNDGSYDYTFIEDCITKAVANQNLEWGEYVDYEDVTHAYPEYTNNLSEAYDSKTVDDYFNEVWNKYSDLRDSLYAFEHAAEGNKELELAAQTFVRDMEEASGDLWVDYQLYVAEPDEEAPDAY